MVGHRVPHENDLRDFVIRKREAGLKASSVNTGIGSVNANARDSLTSTGARSSPEHAEFFHAQWRIRKEAGWQHWQGANR